MLLTKTPIKRKILDFDIEARPLSYLGQDFTTGEITAIAASWVGEEKVYCWQLSWMDMETDQTVRAAVCYMLSEFKEMYDKADIVTGHYIRMFDLPKINGALYEHGMEGLSIKEVCDTKTDLKNFSGVSKSQESLGLMLGHFNVGKGWKYLNSKEHMGQDDWRRANRLTIEGVEETRRRVTGDVKQHKELRLALQKAGMLDISKAWRP